MAFTCPYIISLDFTSKLCSKDILINFLNQLGRSHKSIVLIIRGDGGLQLGSSPNPLVFLNEKETIGAIQISNILVYQEVLLYLFWDVNMPVLNESNYNGFSLQPMKFVCGCDASHSLPFTTEADTLSNIAKTTFNNWTGHTSIDMVIDNICAIYKKLHLD